VPNANPRPANDGWTSDDWPTSLEIVPACDEILDGQKPSRHVSTLTSGMTGKPGPTQFNMNVTK